MTLWDNDLIQFARLLDEIRATQDNLDIDALCESMDLERDDVEELFERAMKVFETSKAELAFTQRGVFHEPIPADFPVRPVADLSEATDPVTCGHCLLTWDDDIVTSYTPAHAARCPFEAFHLHAEDPNA